MAIVKMKRLRLVGMRTEQDELLRRLQHLGCVEIDEPDGAQDDPAWAALTRPDAQALTRAREESGALALALAALKKHVPEKTGLLQARPLVSEKTLFDRDAYATALETAEEINASERRMAAIRAEQSKRKGLRAQLSPWLELDVPLEISSTRDVDFLLGGVAAKTEWSEMEGALSAATELCQLTPAGRDRDYQYLLLAVHKSAEDTALEALKAYGFTRVALRGWTGTAKENDRRLEGEIAALERELGETEQQLVSMASHRRELELAQDRAGQEIRRFECRGRLLDTGTAYFLQGWYPASAQAELERLLGAYTCAWESEDPAPEDYPQVPVKLKNNPLTAPLNVVTDMYSLPAYDGLDPNPLMAPFFIAFFGIMMADMGYGILMIAASLVVLLKTRPREGTRNFMGLVLLCGISTFIVGAMTGGFFGDFIPQIIKIHNPESDFVWFWKPLFTPLDNTVEILLGSLVLGAIQVFTGMAISVVKKIKDGDFIDALFDEITWWIILAGAAMAIFGMGNVAGVPAVLVLGALMLVFGGTRKAKGFGKLASLVGLVYNGVTGFFSDILSYMRLMALMLAGSVIAQVFNTLGAVFGNVVIFVVISMIGNMLNLALNLLGCYVHDLRLQCLEFFGRFYKEGGRPFKPLNIDTKYVDIIKEEQ